MRTFVGPGRRVRYSGEPFDPTQRPDEPFLAELAVGELRDLQPN
jgi:hypothetical protein